jgi:hypothetical protein
MSPRSSCCQCSIPKSQPIRLAEIDRELADVQYISAAEVAEKLAAFEPVWESLSPREQSRLMHLLGHVSQARLSQIMGLLSLAPDIQEAILWLPPVESGDDGVTERDLREVVREMNWGRQRRRWAALGMARAVDAIRPR